MVQCEEFNHLQVFKSLCSLAFFSFLRISNILPLSIVLETCVGGGGGGGGVIFSEQGATIVIKMVTNSAGQETGSNHSYT